MFQTAADNVKNPPKYNISGLGRKALQLFELQHQSFMGTFGLGKCIQTEKNTRWERATSNLHQSCHRARFSDSGPNLRLRMDAKVIHALFLADRTSKCVFLVFFLYNPY